MAIEKQTPVALSSESASEPAGRLNSGLALPRAATKAMPTSALDIQAIKVRQKATWESGDFGQVAKFTMPSAEEFMARIELQPGMKVLDAACGTGNLAVLAARRGCRVSGLDIAANLIAQARERARHEALDIEFTEGDAEAMPYADASFDVVVRDRFKGSVQDLRLTRRVARMCFPFDPAGTVEHLRRYYGPTQRAFETLNPVGRERLRQDLVKLEARHNVSPHANETDTPSEYLEIHARVQGATGV